MQPTAEFQDPQHPRLTSPEVGQWDIAPGETLRPDGSRDLVEEASMESFPASDPPTYFAAPRETPPG